MEMVRTLPEEKFYMLSSRTGKAFSQRVNRGYNRRPIHFIIQTKWK